MEIDYRGEMAQLVSWCHTYNLSLYTEKTKELIINPRKRGDQHNPLHLGETQVDSQHPAHCQEVSAASVLLKGPMT